MSYPIVSRVRTFLHPIITHRIRLYYNKVWGMDIGEGTRISFSAKLDKTNPRGLHIGDHTAITFGVAILSHHFGFGGLAETRIGSCCFIGARSIIMPGVTIGDHCIIGAGSVVTRDIPARSIAIGNPARVIRTGITTVELGRIPPGDENMGEPVPEKA